MCDVGGTRFFRPWNADETGEVVEPTPRRGNGSRGELENTITREDTPAADDPSSVFSLINAESPSDSEMSAGAVCVSVMGEHSKAAQCVSPPV